jgi:fructokinase
LLIKRFEVDSMVVCGLGEVLWDVFPDQEQFGGAPLNFCANLQRLGHHATLLSAVGQDERGRVAIEPMRQLGLNTDGICHVSGFPTGIATISKAANGEPAFVIPRPAAFDQVTVSPELLRTIKASGVGWFYFGTLLQTQPEMEHLTLSLLQELKPARGFYDMNLRTGHWDLPLVQRLSAHASILKLNEAEAETLWSLSETGADEFSLEAFCGFWSAAYRIDVICVTLGPAGCLIFQRSGITRAPGYTVEVCDTVGSGDAFAAAFLHGYDQGWPMQQTARFANALGALVASRAGATPPWTPDEVVAMSSLQA